MKILIYAFCVVTTLLVLPIAAIREIRDGR